MKELKITKVIVNERKELNISMIVKEWDYTEIEAELLRQAKINWDLLDISFNWLTQWDVTKERKSKLNQLAMNMLTYSEKFWIDIDTLKTNLYNKYKITSRSHLSDTDLDIENEWFKTAIINWIA